MKKLSKGFTLIELMIVVAIIGILAAIAIPNFMKYQLRSKFSEASSNIEGLRKAEEAVRQGERKITVKNVVQATYAPGSYWDIGGGKLPVAGVVGTAKMTWTPDDLAAAAGIDWTVEGATYFQYQVSVAGCPTSDATMKNAGICYGVGAIADIDGDKTIGEAALVKPFIDPADPTKITKPTMPTILTTAFPGTMGSCVDKDATTPIYATPCTLSGPDVF